jgi:hypothetical protein
MGVKIKVINPSIMIDWTTLELKLYKLVNIVWIATSSGIPPILRCGLRSSYNWIDDIEISRIDKTEKNNLKFFMKSSLMSFSSLNLVLIIKMIIVTMISLRDSKTSSMLFH